MQPCARSTGPSTERRGTRARWPPSSCAPRACFPADRRERLAKQPLSDATGPGEPRQRAADGNPHAAPFEVHQGLARRGCALFGAGVVGMNKPLGPAERLNVERVLKTGGRRGRGVVRGSGTGLLAVLAIAAARRSLASSRRPVETRPPATSPIPVTRGSLSVIVTATGLGAADQPGRRVERAVRHRPQGAGRLQLAGQGRRGAGRARHRQAQGHRRQLARQAQCCQGQGGRGRGDGRREGAGLQPQEQPGREADHLHLRFRGGKGRLPACRRRPRQRACRRRRGTGRSRSQRDQPRQGLDTSRRSTAWC